MQIFLKKSFENSLSKSFDFASMKRFPLFILAYLFVSYYLYTGLQPSFPESKASLLVPPFELPPALPDSCLWSLQNPKQFLGTQKMEKRAGLWQPVPTVPLGPWRWVGLSGPKSCPQFLLYNTQTQCYHQASVGASMDAWVLESFTNTGVTVGLGPYREVLGLGVR